MDEDTFFKTKRQVVEYIDRRVDYLEKRKFHAPVVETQQVVYAIEQRISELEALRKYLRNVMLFKKEENDNS